MGIYEERRENAEMAELLRRFLDGNTTPEEYARVVSWFENLRHDEQGVLDSDLYGKTRDKQWEIVSGKVRSDNKIDRRGTLVLRWSWASLGIAASIVLAVGFFHSSNFRQWDRSTARQQEQKTTTQWKTFRNDGKAILPILLEDNSTISLRPRGEVTYNVADQNNRLVKLQGEAFFVVAKDERRPFKVFTNDVITTVLGTSFLISAPSLHEPIMVSVSTGSVSVSKILKDGRKGIQGDQGVIITPNQQVVYNPGNGLLKASLVTSPGVLEVQKRKVVYDEERVQFILDELIKTYGVEIQYDQNLLYNCQITTAFSDEGLFKRLDILSKAIGATYHVEGTKIIFVSSGCI